MRLSFAKYHGAGNDFVLIDGRSGAFEPTPEQVAHLCHRRFGVGADGLMILASDAASDFRMRYFNADGGEATMCGNGGRCIALFAHHLGIGGAQKTFQGIDGLHSVSLLSEQDANTAQLALSMIDVERVECLSPELKGVGAHYFLDTGSPHYVEIVESVEAIDVQQRGAEIRHSERFASIGGTNVNFVELSGEGKIRVRTFERGVEDETLACGTGSTAAALVAALHTQTPHTSYRVEVEGGVLQVDFQRKGQEHFTKIILTGPAQRIFEGEFLL